MNIVKLVPAAFVFLLSTDALAMKMQEAKMTDIPHDSYSFDLIKNLDFEPVRGSKSKALLKEISSYPQGFYIDNKSNQLFVLRYAMKKPNIPVIDIYSWDKLVYEKTLFLKDTDSRISEGLHVDNKDGKQLLYVRGKNSLLEFTIPSNVSDGEFLSGKAVLNAPVAQSFSFGKDKVFVESFDPKLAKEKQDQTRGNYFVYDRSFSKIGNISFEQQYAGTNKSEENKSPKHQGFSAYSEGFIMSMGGYWKTGKPVTPYSYQGFNFFDNKGHLVSSRYIKPDAMVKLINDHGVKADRIENEGVQVLEDGSIITLNVIQASPKNTGGLLLLKLSDEAPDSNMEKRSKENRLDLSPAAVKQ